MRRLVEATKAEQSELGKLVDDAFLSEAAPLFTNFWLHTTLAVAQRPLPKLFNSDGEELEFCEVQFPVSAMNSKEIKQRLRSVKGLSPADDRSVNWQWLAEEADTRLTPALPETGLAWGTVDEEGRKILGSIELRDRSLVLSTNSRERAERGEGFLKTALGDLVGTSLTSVQTVERLMEEERPAARPDPEPELPLGLEDQIFAEYSDRHYQQTLSQKIPALGDRTPRQAARSKTGRVKLVKWLKYLENAETRRARQQEQSPYDFSWMWEELGISDLRE